MALNTYSQPVNNAYSTDHYHYLFKYPITHLIAEKNKRLMSDPPLRWNLEKEGLLSRSIKKKSWHKGEPLETITKDALRKLGFKEDTTPENLGHKEFYKNCNYQNNGYGAGFIGYNTLIEAKVRSGYLTPIDFYHNVRPRFEDLDPYHKMHWILIIWGKVSPKTRDLIKKNSIHLIVIPFAIDHRVHPSKELIQRTTAYVAERLKETMPLFTTTHQAKQPALLVKRVKLEKCCVRVFYASGVSYNPVLSGFFDPISWGLHRRFENEMRVYRLLARDERWANTIEAYRESMRNELRCDG